MIKADFENGMVVVKANQKIILENEFMMIYYALEKTNPDVLDRATDMIERWTKEGLDADDFIKKVEDLHGLGDYKMRQILKLVFMLFIRVFALTVFFSSIAEHDTYYVAMAIWVWLMGNTIEDSWGIKIWVK